MNIRPDESRTHSPKTKGIMKLLSIIIPVYNEEKRLDKTFSAISSLMLPRELKLKEIIFVNDGSTDKTTSLISRFIKTSKHPISLISYSQNKGKGYAVKIGMMNTASDYSLLCDADMSTPFSELKQFIPFIKQNADVVIGTRKNGKSTVIVHQPWLRENMGKIFTYFTKTILRINITDFTCGFKLFSEKAVEVIFPKSIINRWGYDAEILYIASKENLQIQERHVIWSNEKLSHVNILTAVPNTLFEIGTILYIHSVQPSIRKMLAANILSLQNSRFTQRITSLF